MPSYDTFPSTVIGPSFPVDKSVEPRVKRVSFGDGYTQESPDGLNTLLHTWNLTWNAVTYAERTTITDFLKAKGGYQSFYWLDAQGTQHLVKAPTWTESNIEPNIYKITATFKQSVIL
jgi:phage-related protein